MPEADDAERIFVFGCSRSGTTLLLNLFRAFRSTQVVDREHRLEEFSRYQHARCHVVMKRTPICALDLGIELERRPEVWLVDIVRDPRDVVTSRYGGSRGFHTDFRRWERDVVAAESAQRTHTRLLRERFEDLVLHPQLVQERLAARIGLRAERSFAETAASLDQEREIGPKERGALNGPRPLDPRTIGRWRSSADSLNRVREQVVRFPSMTSWLVRYGFEVDDGWLDSLGPGFGGERDAP
jgi:hypothetical protein